MVRFILNKYETIDMPQKIILWFYKLKKMKKKKKIKKFHPFSSEKENKDSSLYMYFPVKMLQ